MTKILSTKINIGSILNLNHDMSPKKSSFVIMETMKFEVRIKNVGDENWLTYLFVGTSNFCYLIPTFKFLKSNMFLVSKMIFCLIITILILHVLRILCLDVRLLFRTCLWVGVLGVLDFVLTAFIILFHITCQKRNSVWRF